MKKTAISPVLPYDHLLKPMFRLLTYNKVRPARETVYWDVKK